jgi:hypothetical protein
MINFIKDFFIWILLPGFVTHLMMYIKCRTALGWHVKLPYSITGYYDILNKDRADPRSFKLNGLVIILNGIVALPVYILTQLYWTFYLGFDAFIKIYVKKNTLYKFKYILKSSAAWQTDINTIKIGSNQDKVKENYREQLEGYIDYNDELNWNRLISVSEQGQFYFLSTPVTEEELINEIKTFRQKVQEISPINNIEEIYHF